MTKDHDERSRPFATLSDEELLGRLLHAGLDVPPGLPEEVVRRGEAVVEPLCAWVQDEALRESDEDDAWAPMHALHVLGAIGHPAAIPAVLGVALHADLEDAVHEGLACIMARIGPAVVSPAKELLRTSPEDVPATSWTNVVRGLVAVGRDHPHERPGLARLFVELLSDPACDADERTAWAVAELATVFEADVVAAVDAAFERGAAGWVVSREEVRDARAGSPAWTPEEYRTDPLEWFSKDNLEEYRRPLEWSPTSIPVLDSPSAALSGPATGERHRSANRASKQAKARRKAARKARKTGRGRKRRKRKRR